MKKILAISTLVSSMVLTSMTAFADSATSSAAKSSPAPAATKSDNGVVSKPCVQQNPSDFTRGVTDSVMKILNDNKALIKTQPMKVQELIEDALKLHIAINDMSRFVVGAKLFDKAKEVKQQEFDEQFFTFISDFLGTSLSSFDHQKIVIYKQRTDDWKTQPRTMVYGAIKDNNGAPDIPIAFVLKKDVCKYKFLDFLVEGMSVISSLQQQIKAIQRQDDIKSLEQITVILKEKNEKNRSKG